MQDFGDTPVNATTIPRTTPAITRPHMAQSTVYLPTVFPTSGGATTAAPIRVDEIESSKKPTTKEKGTPLKDYPTVFPGLAYSSKKPSESSKNLSVIATRPTKLQNQEAITANIPGNENQPGYGSAKYYPRTTNRPVLKTTNAAGYQLTTGGPSAKYGKQIEETVSAEQKDDFAYQTQVNLPNGQTNVAVPHQVFNPEQEAQEDKEAEEERQRLLSATTPAPVTFMRDSDEDVTSPDNENKDSDWHGLQYGPLALPPAFQSGPSSKGLLKNIIRLLKNIILLLKTLCVDLLINIEMEYLLIYIVCIRHMLLLIIISF